MCFSSGILDWITCRGLCCCCQCCCLNTGSTGAGIYPRSGRWLENPMLKCFWVKEEVWLHLCECEIKAPNVWAERKTGGAKSGQQCKIFNFIHYAKQEDNEHFMTYNLNLWLLICDHSSSAGVLKALLFLTKTEISFLFWNIWKK